MIRFKVHPIQREFRTVVEAEAELVDLRKVRSSSGVETLRPVIVTPLELGDGLWDIEVTLVRRDAMGFRMLLGQAGDPSATSSWTRAAPYLASITPSSRSGATK